MYLYIYIYCAYIYHNHVYNISFTEAPIIISKSGMYISVQRDHMAILSFKITQAIPLVKTKDIIWIFPDNSSTIDIGRNNASDYIFSEDKLTLKILKAGIMDGGSYTVYVNNSKGKDSAKVSLTITGGMNA